MSTAHAVVKVKTCAYEICGALAIINVRITSNRNVNNMHGLHAKPHAMLIKSRL